MGLDKVLAIDVGGSKTEVVVFDVASNKVIEWFIGESCKIHDMPLEEVEARLRDIVSSIDIDFGDTVLSIGIAGLDTRFDYRYWWNILNNVFPRGVRINLFHDVVEVLYAGGYGEPGLVVIAGTGFNAYGWNGVVEAKAGDWGWRIGDEASAYRLGVLLLNIAFRYVDGRGGSRDVYEHVLDYLGLGDWEELLDWVYKSGVDDIASLAPLACKMLDINSVREILVHMVEEAIISLWAVSKRVGLKGPVHYTGGLFKCDFFRNLFIESLEREGFYTGNFVDKPVLGAIYKALIDFFGFGRDMVIDVAKEIRRQLDSTK